MNSPSGRVRFAFHALGALAFVALAAGCSAPVSGNDAEETESTGTEESALHGCDSRPEVRLSLNSAGISATVTALGVDRDNAFFKSIGTNGRTCATCHVESEGWTVTPAGIRERFESTGGRDPIFRTVDGSTSPRADVSTVAARKKAYRLLLDRGLVRVGMPIPANAEFELAAVDDPYHFASATELSLFRRPLPTTNVSFLSATMWDGRHTVAGRGLDLDLEEQANAATLGHAQSTRPLTAKERHEIVAFEKSLFSAQILDRRAGRLDVSGAEGGPRALSEQPFFLGINDPLGGNPTGAPFVSDSFSIFRAWDGKHGGEKRDAQGSIARGERIFGTHTFTVKDVRGVNNVLGVPALTATCTTCHDSPNVGNHSVRFPLDLGLTHEDRRRADMPLYTLRNKATGETMKTTDPGRALVTGKWNDVSLFKGPVLRGLAARAPYFHDGSAASLDELVDFYEERFSLGLTSGERDDLIAFLRSL